MSSPTSPERALLVGVVIAERYEVRALLGEGGMARVYAAHDRKHDRPVAIKMLRDELTLALGADRFLREIRISARLSHPHILPLYDSGEHAGALFYVMPLVEGESLRERLARTGPIPLEEAAQLAREVAEALTYAHEQGFVHRDIKPDNIMLARGHALVADFGIARALSSVPDVSLTSTGFSLGTPLYMSPEQALSDPGLNYQTDIYSLGCVVYEMLTGHPPFIATNATALLARHISEPAPDLPAQFPTDVADVVRRALAKQPGDRFPTALGFADALASGVHSSAATAGVRRQDTRPINAGLRLLRAGRRHHLPILLAALVLAFILTGIRAVRYVIAYQEEGGPVAAPDSTDAWVGNWTEPLTMVALGDTAIGIQQGPSLVVFNGREWNRVLLPYEQTQLAVIAGDVWGFNAAGAGREQRLAAAGWIPGDSIPIAALAVWSKGSDIVIANSRGEFAERTQSRWQQIPSGRRTVIVKLFGPSRDSLTGIGAFAMNDNSDSLIRRVGQLWQSFDPQGRRSNEWIYQDGATLMTGHSLIVGYELKSSSQRTPLLLTRRPGSGDWTRVESATRDIPQHQLDQILPLANGEALLWSSVEPGLLVLRNQRSSLVEVLRDRHVRAAAALGRVPVVLTDVGSLMIRRGSDFEFYGELPLRPGAGTGNLTYGELAALTGLLGSSRLTVTRAVRSGSRTWMLTEDSAVYSAHCRGMECSARIEFGGESEDVTDLAASGPRAIVVGRGGLISEWQGDSWITPRWARQVTGDLQLVSVAQDGATMIARRDSIFLIGPGSTDVHVVSTEGRGTPEAIAASRDSGAAALWSNTRMKLAWDGTVVRTYRRFGPQFTSARYTCDGRLMTTSAAAGDPLMGGDADAGWVNGYANLSFKELPVPLDLSDVVINSVGTIRLIGRGGVWLSTPSLEHAAVSCADTTGARHRGLGMESLVPDW